MVEPCKYGSACTRKNPKHFEEFYHPPKDETKPVCKYGAACRRTNPQHFEEFSHPESVSLPRDDVKPPRFHPTKSSRWKVAMDTLSTPLASLGDFEDAVGEYRQLEPGQRFHTLQHVLDELLSADERLNFFQELLPGIVELAMDLPVVCSDAVPFLRAGESGKRRFDQRSLASLLANMFLCTFARDDFGVGRDSGAEFSDFDFLRLLSMHPPVSEANAQKLHCFLHYFKTILARQKAGESLTNEVWFERRTAPDCDWNEVSATLGEVNFSMRAEGTIEDADPSGRAWQADFANSYIGGGVLGRGCVQEEIRFAISPELCVSKLLMERMRDDEAIVITGSERFCNYQGYASSFKFAGGHADASVVEAGCRATTVTCFDAVRFRGPDSQIKQFRPALVRRELTKALAALSPTEEMQRGPRARWPPVVTGNWGCGDFGGVVELKFVIQLMAAAAAGRGCTVAETLFQLRVLHNLQSSKGELLDMVQFFRDSPGDVDSEALANAEALAKAGEEEAAARAWAEGGGGSLEEEWETAMGPSVAEGEDGDSDLDRGDGAVSASHRGPISSLSAKLDEDTRLGDGSGSADKPEGKESESGESETASGAVAQTTAGGGSRVLSSAARDETDLKASGAGRSRDGDGEEGSEGGGSKVDDEERETKQAKLC